MAIFVKSVIRAAMVDIPIEFSHIEIVCVDLTFSFLLVVLFVFILNPVLTKQMWRISMNASGA